MASEPGGRAAKFGDDYERLWTVRHLVELISGDALAMKVEPSGPDGQGVEFRVDRKGGIREWREVKA